ncbi:hypothetical protein SSAG_06149 [Streptomyces sp. Mg1]|nr:hypothetical protein SSAG_06149 [Streptomyces sp. Mg1]
MTRTILPICHRNLRGSPRVPGRTRGTSTCTLGGAHADAVVRDGGAARFSDLPHPRGTGPERFKGGTCSFGARTRPCGVPGLSRADSSGRYAVGVQMAHIIARGCRVWAYGARKRVLIEICGRSTPGPAGTGTPGLPSLYTWWARGPEGPIRGRRSLCGDSEYWRRRGPWKGYRRSGSPSRPPPPLPPCPYVTCAGRGRAAAGPRAGSGSPRATSWWCPASPAAARAP